MKLKDLPGASLEQLIDAYRQAVSAHYQATDEGDSKKMNRHYDIATAIRRELRARGLEAQRALLPLLEDPDDAIRGPAASHALEFAPEQAEPVLAALAERSGFPAFDARMTLREWRKGNLKFRY